jgi:hypothetical protein
MTLLERIYFIPQGIRASLYGLHFVKRIRSDRRKDGNLNEQKMLEMEECECGCGGIFTCGEKNYGP